MNVFLTGGTGLIGSAVLNALIAEGHQVCALVRSEESGQKVEAVGATHLLANIEGTDELTEYIAPFDAVIHTASPSDATSAAVDLSVATAAINAFANTNKVYVHTGGVWVYGSGTDIDEANPYNPPAITAWRRDVESVALSGQGMRTSVVEPGPVYGHGGGLFRLLTQMPRTDTGAVEMVGDGSQHWPVVYVDDLAALYVLVLSKGQQGRYIGASGKNPTVREMCEAISRASGNGDVIPGSLDSARERFGPLADAFLLDQQTRAVKSHDLGWTPSGPSIIDELETGSYSPKSLT